MWLQVGSLPRSPEEAGRSFNYQLNLIGLQAEQWATDNWAKYLRQRQRWLKGSSAKGKPGSKAGKGGGGGGWLDGVHLWWDVRVSQVNKGWVKYQLESAKSEKASKELTKGGAAKGAAKGGGAPARGERGLSCGAWEKAARR